MAQYVFISASLKDRSFANLLAKDLLASGVDVWLPTSNIAPGSDWHKEIVAALKNAAVLIVVASSQSQSSGWDWQLYEAGVYFGIGKDKRLIIPAILDEVGLRIPPPLDQYDAIDFRQNYKTALGQLVELLPSELVHSKPEAPKPVKSKGYIFLSYAEEDREFVRDLKKFLAEKKYAYWDYEDSVRDYHTQLFRELEKAITEAAATISVISPSWKKSRWTIREYHFSEDAGIPVLLVQPEDPGPTLAISGMPYIDFEKDQDAGYEKLSRELDRKGL